jgi:hypothetical protein
MSCVQACGRPSGRGREPCARNIGAAVWKATVAAMDFVTDRERQPFEARISFLRRGREFAPAGTATRATLVRHSGIACAVGRAHVSGNAFGFPNDSGLAHNARHGVRRWGCGRGRGCPQGRSSTRGALQLQSGPKPKAFARTTAQGKASSTWAYTLASRTWSRTGRYWKRSSRHRVPNHFWAGGGGAFTNRWHAAASAERSFCDHRCGARQPLERFLWVVWASVASELPPAQCAAPPPTLPGRTAN